MALAPHTSHAFLFLGAMVLDVRLSLLPYTGCSDDHAVVLRVRFGLVEISVCWVRGRPTIR